MSASSIQTVSPDSKLDAIPCTTSYPFRYERRFEPCFLKDDICPGGEKTTSPLFEFGSLLRMWIPALTCSTTAAVKGALFRSTPNELRRVYVAVFKPWTIRFV